MDRKSAVVQARLDYGTVASLARWMVESARVPIASRSDLLYKVTEMFAIGLERNGSLRRFESLPEAREYLKGLGLEQLTVGDRSKGIFRRAMEEEDLEMEFGEAYAGRRKAKSYQPLRGQELSEEEIRREVEKVLRSQGRSQSPGLAEATPEELAERAKEIQRRDAALLSALANPRPAELAERKGE